jgi:hypothetical protein
MRFDIGKEPIGSIPMDQARWGVKKYLVPIGSLSENGPRGRPKTCRQKESERFSAGSKFVMPQAVRAAFGRCGEAGRNFQVPPSIAGTNPGFNGLGKSPEASNHSFH